MWVFYVAGCFLLLAFGVATVFSVAGNTGFGVARVSSVAADAGALRCWQGVLRFRAGAGTVCNVATRCFVCPRGVFRFRTGVSCWCSAGGCRETEHVSVLFAEELKVDYKVDSTHHFAKKLQCKDGRAPAHEAG